MARPRVAAGGGLAAVAYVLRKGREAGGLLRLYRRLRSRNACKSCALGMGGQQGGMVNEAGHFPEVCKKAVQAQAGDMVAPIAERYFRSTPIAAMERLGSAELERLGRRAFPVLLAGANPASNHPRLVGQLVQLRRRGGKVLMVNPLRELGLVRFRVPSDWRSMLFGSTVSDLYLQPHVGADVVLFKALLKGVVEAGVLDRAFVAEPTSGWEAVAADLAASSWEELIERSGVARAEIEHAVALLAAARRGVFCW